MSFPQREWKNISDKLDKTGSCSSVRSCLELDKYKKGETYKTPWGDTIKITKVTRYKKAEDIPTWNLMDEKMKNSVRKGEVYGSSKWDYVVFKKIN